MRRRRRDEAGSTLVEFALLLPVFAMLLLGLVTAGIALERQQQLTSAAQQAARYGATVPASQCALASACNGLTWAGLVQSVAVARSDGLLSDAQVCAALVTGPGSAPVAIDASHTTAGGTAPCFIDNATTSADRVQVAVTFGDHVDALVFDRSVTLSASADALFEATG